MELWMWTIAVAVAIGGGMWGYAFGRTSDNDGTQAREKSRSLERELTTLQREFGGYREEVNSHFRSTAELVHELTNSYKAVYEHLALGSQKLCAGEVLIDAKEAPKLEGGIVSNPADAQSNKGAAESVIVH